MKNTFFIIILCHLLFGCGSDDDTNEELNNTLEDAVIQEILVAHNSYRSDVGISNITWSEEIATSAQAWADELASNCEFKHSGGEYGENIWAGTEGAFEPTDVVNSWGSEITDYNYESNTCATDKDCGHYTQIVWKNTTQVGCGVATCDGLDIWVCQYDPPGNFIGEQPY
ncbi:MAG: pathogenesis-related family 1 protein [Reichenbachiella sp.]|uniref:pathogenesis-related family 1 protein n=2 Tax=Reichenbachiella sp. TaxID=2184521 RepID=UPI003298A2CF